MSLGILKFSLANVIICTVSSPLYIGMSYSCVVCCCCVCPLCCTLVNCICSKTFLTSVSSCIIFFLCFFEFSYASAMRSCTFFVTNYASSSIMGYWGTSLCTFIFLRAPDCRIVLLGGLDSIFSVVIGVSVSGMSPPACPSCERMLSSLCVSPLVASTWFFHCATGLVMAFFCLSVLVAAVRPVCPTSLLVFPTRVLFFSEEASYDGFLSFVGSIGTFHSSFQSFISHCTSSIVTQYLIYNHSFSGSLFAWIYILCLDALKMAIFLYSSTTSGGILQVSTTFSCIYSRFVTNMLEFVFISLATVVFHNVLYCVVRHFPIL
jgi:hypothetical protein